MFPDIIMEADLTKDIPVRTRKRNELVDITSTIRRLIAESGVSEGICHIFVPHTTAAVTINEKADPAVASDISNTLEKIVPAGWEYRHAEGNSDSHCKSSFFGCSERIIVKNAALNLGTWQGIFFCEFDGPRNRTVQIHVHGK